MKEIPLTRGYVALVDDGDFAGVSVYRWCVSDSSKIPYAVRFVRKVNGKLRVVRMHREIAKCPRGKDVDHINGNTMDNRRSNLRTCSRAENVWNCGLSVKNTSGYKGISVDKKQQARGGPCYRAQIRVRGERLSCGMFATREDAARAYDSLAIQYHGKFAWTNFPASAQHFESRADSANGGRSTEMSGGE